VLQVHENSPMFSIDCEMCLTEQGMELTRVNYFIFVFFAVVMPYRHRPFLGNKNDKNICIQ
jgi:hypothetical protein